MIACPDFNSGCSPVAYSNSPGLVHTKVFISLLIYINDGLRCPP
jgi:hypothetical protein